MRRRIVFTTGYRKDIVLTDYFRDINLLIFVFMSYRRDLAARAIRYHKCKIVNFICFSSENRIIRSEFHFGEICGIK